MREIRMEDLVEVTGNTLVWCRKQGFTIAEKRPRGFFEKQRREH